LAQVKDKTSKTQKMNVTTEKDGDKESVAKASPTKRGRQSQKKYAVVAPKVKKAKGTAVATKDDNDMESDYSE
jgi:hypothetical protein